MSRGRILYYCLRTYMSTGLLDKLGLQTYIWVKLSIAQYYLFSFFLPPYGVKIEGGGCNYCLLSVLAYI